MQEDDPKRIDLMRQAELVRQAEFVRNERTKLTATWLNDLGVGAIVAASSRRLSP